MERQLSRDDYRDAEFLWVACWYCVCVSSVSHDIRDVSLSQLLGGRL